MQISFCKTRLIGLLLTSLLAAAPAFGQEQHATAATPELDFTALEEAALEEMQATKTPGAAIAIVREGKITWAKGLGVANVETGQPVTPETLFRLGSTTKMFTAAALVTLADEGKVNLHEPIGKCIAGLRPEIAALSAHQLMTHTAGLTDESIMSGSHDDDALADGIRQIDASWCFTQPGAIYSYANPGYWIAGLACQELEGKPYADVMEERLFRPLGMSRTTLRPMLAMTWPLALGHEVRHGEPAIVRPQADNAATWPAGQMYSNVVELARFATAFMDDGRLDGEQVLSPAVIKKLQTPYVQRPGDGGHYGYGLAISDERSVLLVQHGGSRSGYGSTIRMAPKHKIAVIILTNRSASSLPKTAVKALEAVLPLEPASDKQDAEPQPLTESEIADLVGVYTNHRQTVELLVEEGKLVVRRNRDSHTQRLSGDVLKSGEDRLAVASASQTDGDEPRVSLVVVRDKTGKPEYLISSGRALKRVAPPAAPAADSQRRDR